MSETKPATDSSYESNPFKVIFRGFNKIFEINPTWSIIIIAAGFFGAGSNFFPSSGSSSGGNENIAPAVAAVIIIFALLFVFAAVIIGVLYRGAVAYVTVKTIEGQRVGFMEAVKAAWGKFWTILWIQIVVGLKVLGGLILFIVPGIRAALRYQMVLLPLFAENKGSKESIHDVKSLTKDHLIEVFGMVTAAGIIPIIGSLFSVGGQVVMYPQLKHLKSSGAPKPPVHWLNYLGFILMAVFLLLITGLSLLVIALLAARR